jgi:hypothetical protein
LPPNHGSIHLDPDSDKSITPKATATPTQETYHSTRLSQNTNFIHPTLAFSLTNLNFSQENTPPTQHDQHLRALHAGRRQGDSALQDPRQGYPPSVRNTLKLNGTLSNQLLSVTNGTIGVLTFPILTTDQDNRPCIIGTFGNDTNNMAPTAISGDLLHQSISVLVPSAHATKYNLLVLDADPLTLEPPPPSTDGAGPDRLHYIFTDPTFAPVIAALPATFSGPLGIPAPLGWNLSTTKISEAAFLCEAGRVWIKAVAHLLTHYNGKPILSVPTLFKTTDLNLAPFAGHDMAPSVSTD